MPTQSKVNTESSGKNLLTAESYWKTKLKTYWNRGKIWKYHLGNFLLGESLKTRKYLGNLPFDTKLFFLLFIYRLLYLLLNRHIPFFRYTIYSPKDGQPCMDHDRQTGEVIFLVDIFMRCLWFLNTEWKKCILVKCILYMLYYLFSVVSTCENWMNSTFENTYPELWIVFSTVAIFCDYLAICATNITTAYHYLFVETKQEAFVIVLR